MWFVWEKDDKFKVLDTCKYNYDGSIKLEDYLENIDFDLKDFLISVISMIIIVYI